MPPLRGITVSVGQWYASLLAITLVRNQRHLVETLVVTAPGDPAVEVARAVPGVRVFETTAFFEHGARFNKGYSLELGFDQLGRHGWIVVWDADCLWPDSLPLDRLRPDCLHGATRRVLADPGLWTPGLDWSACPKHPDGNAPIGHTQIFSADAPAIKDRRPWYNVNSPHAGLGDAEFLERFPVQQRVMLPMEVLHLGPVDSHWWGTDEAGKDMMAAYVHRMGWRRAMRHADPTATERVGELPERIDVPGYEMSDYLMPFERRAKQQGKR